MALRNAFENLATEAKQDGIIGLLRLIARSTTYPRTSTEVLRVNVDAGAMTNTLYFGNANGTPSWYSTGAPAALDTREQQMMSSNIALGQAMQRWTVT